MRRFNFVALQLFLQWLICLICLSCSGDHAAQDVSKQNFVVKEGTRSIDIKEVNNYISTANITMLADLKYNRALIVHHGVIVDSFPIITGGYSAQNFSQSQTPLGVFTVHAIDYCPPWYSASTKEGKIPCTDANRLGPYSLWFKDGYIYGVHGRPPNKYLQQLFTSLGSSDRKGSKGCIVVPQDHLKNFIDLIFDDPAFKNHPGVKKIKELRSHKDPKNVFIALQDFQEKIPYFYNIKEKVGTVVKIDIKLIAIDTSDPTTWSSWGSSKKEHPVYQLMKSGDSLKKSYRLVTDCTVKVPISVYQGSSARSNANKIDELQIGDRLTYVYKHPHRSSSRVDLEFYKDGRKNKTEGWISDLNNLTCSRDYYWSSRTKSTLK